MIQRRLALLAVFALAGGAFTSVPLSSVSRAAPSVSSVAEPEAPALGHPELQSRAGFDAAIRAATSSVASPGVAPRLGSAGVTDRVGAIGTASEPPASALATFPTKFFGTSSNARPSDGTIAVGPSHVLQAVNKAIAIFTKTGSLVSRQTLNAFFGVPETVYITDPRVLFDPISQRWLVVALQNSTATRASYLFYGFSATSDPSSPYCYYSSNQTTGNSTFTSVQADFPGLGYDEFALYITLSRFSWGSGYPADAKIIMLPRAPLLSCVANFNSVVFLTTRPLPGDFDAPVIMPTVSFGSAPAAYFVASQDGGGQYVGLWQITNRSDPSTATLSYSGPIAVAPYARPQPGRQRGSTVLVDFGDARITSPAVWRNGSLYFAFGVNSGYQTNGASWFELSTASRAIRQSGVLQFNGGSYGMPSVIVDATGGMALLAAVSGTDYFLGSAVATRAAGDPLGQLTQPTIFAPGLSAYEDLVAFDSVRGERWGDYFGIALDPDGQRIWVEGTYAASAGSWATAIASTMASAPATTTAYRLSTSVVAVTAGVSTTLVAQLTLLTGTAIAEPGRGVTWSAQPAAQFTPPISTTDATGRATVQFLSASTPTSYTVTARDSTGATGTLAVATAAPRVATATVYLPNITKTLGGATGWVTPFYVQNAGTVATDLEVTYYRFADGSQVVQRTVSALPAGASYTDNPNSDSDLPDDTQFSVVVRSFGAPAVAAVNQVQTTSAGAIEALSYAGFNGGSSTVYVPNVTRRFYGYDVPLIIQNLGSTTTTVTATFTSFDGTQVVPISLSVGAGRSGVIDPDFAPGLTDGTQYAVKLTSAQPIGVVANAHNEAIGPVAFSYNGLAGGATAVYAPYAAKGATSSPIVVQNLGASVASATLAFTLLSGGLPQSFTLSNIAPGGSRAFDVRFPSGVAQANTPLCTTATAVCLGDGIYSLVVTSGVPIAAVILPNSNTTAAGYVALTAPTNKVVLPIIQRNVGGWNTTVYLQSVGATSATLSYFTIGTAALAATQTVPLAPGRTTKIDPSTVAGLAVGSQYSVVIVGNGAIAAIADEFNPAVGDGDMIYEGFGQ